MRVFAFLLGIVGGLAGLLVGNTLLVTGLDILSYGANWRAGYGLGQVADLSLTFSGGALLGLSGLIGLTGGLLAIARPRPARRLMLAGAAFILVTTTATAGLLCLGDPNDARIAPAVAFPMLLPGLALLLASLLLSRRSALVPAPAPVAWQGVGATGPSPATTCLTCGASMPSDARYCGACGTPLRSGECWRCHRAIIPGERFCRACGASINSGLQAIRAQVPRPATARPSTRRVE